MKEKVLINDEIEKHITPGPEGFRLEYAGMGLSCVVGYYKGKACNIWVTAGSDNSFLEVL